MKYVHSPYEAADTLISEIEGADLAIVVFPTREAFVLSVEDGRERLLYGGFDDVAGPTFSVELRSGWNRDRLVALIANALPRPRNDRSHGDGSRPSHSRRQ